MDNKIQSLEPKHLEIIIKISQAVSKTLNLEKILEMATRLTAQALKADRCGIGFLSSKDTFTIIHSYRKKFSYPSISGAKFNLTQHDYITSILLKRKIVHIFDHKKIPLSIKTKKLFGQLGLKVLLIVPIVSDGKVFGSFHLGRVEKNNPFSSSEIKLCQSIATQVGIAIKNATLLNDLKTKFEQQQIIQSISRSLYGITNLQKLFNIIIQKTCEIMKMDRAGLTLYDETKEEGITVATSFKLNAGTPQPHKKDPLPIRLRYNIVDSPEIYKSIRKMKFFATEEMSSVKLSSRIRKYIRKTGIKSSLIVPMFFRGKIIGTINLHTLKDKHVFTENEIRFCQTIANLASLAIENVKLLKVLQEKSTQIEQQSYTLEKQLREQSILLDISKSLAQTLDLKKLLDIVTRKTAEHMNVDRALIAVLDEKKGISTLMSIHIKEKNRIATKNIKKYRSDFPVLNRLLKKKRGYYTSDITRSSLSSKEINYFKKEGIKSYLAVPFSLEGQGVLSLSTFKEKRNFTKSDVTLCRAIVNQLSVAVENARLVQDLHDKSEEIKQKSKHLENKFREERILLDISKALSQTLDLRKLFKIVTRKTAELLKIDRCAAMLIDENKKTILLYTAFTCGKHEPESQEVERRLDDFPKLLNTVEKKHIFYSSDISQANISSKEKNYFDKLGVKSVLDIPFVLKKKILGVLALNTLTEKRKFTNSEIKLCQAIANQLSIAVENAQLIELTKTHSKELEELTLKIINAQEDERKNLAGKLHDVIAQDLTAIQFDLKMSQKLLPEKDDQLKTKLAESEKLVTHSLESLRNLTSDLRPHVLDNFGLPSAIHWYVDNFMRRTGLKIDLKISEFSCNFSPEFETVIYRIIQESLTNIAKHSQATHASISLYKKGNNSRIIIKDNGVGFELKKSSFVNGLGLIRLKENTELLGGKFKVISKKGRGTKLNITLPC